MPYEFFHIFSPFPIILFRELRSPFPEFPAPSQTKQLLHSPETYSLTSLSQISLGKKMSGWSRRVSLSSR